MKTHVGITSVLRRYYVGVLALPILLGACAPTGGFRDSDIPIASTTRFEAARFAGDWRVRAAFPGDEGLVAVAFVKDPPGTVVLERVTHACPEPECELTSTLWPAQLKGPARYSADPPGQVTNVALWVLWVDEGFRTAAVGTPDGRWGWILDRAADGGADRIAAAREVLAFNGYDVSRLQMRP